jgi:hypothetical protein
VSAAAAKANAVRILSRRLEATFKELVARLVPAENNTPNILKMSFNPNLLDAAPSAFVGEVSLLDLVNCDSYKFSRSFDFKKNMSARVAAVPPDNLTNLIMFCLITFMSLAIEGKMFEFLAAICVF